MTSKVHVIISSQVALGLRLFRDMRLTTLRNTMLHQTNTNTIMESMLPKLGFHSDLAIWDWDFEKDRQP